MTCATGLQGSLITTSGHWCFFLAELATIEQITNENENSSLWHFASESQTTRLSANCRTAIPTDDCSWMSLRRQINLHAPSPDSYKRCLRSFFVRTVCQTLSLVNFGRLRHLLRWLKSTWPWTRDLAAYRHPYRHHYGHPSAPYSTFEFSKVESIVW